DNYGPIVIPKKGDVIALNAETFDAWEIFIKREGHSASLHGDKVRIDGNDQSSYTVQRNYVFGMGDNRDNSLDSRFWGFIPEEAVIGTPLIVYWPWNPEVALYDIGDKVSSIRMGRSGSLVHSR